MASSAEDPPLDDGPSAPPHAWRASVRLPSNPFPPAKLIHQVTADGPDPRDWLAAIIDGSDDAIISKNLRGIIQSWNPAATRLFGYEAEEVIGKSITILIPEDRLDEEPAILAEIQRGMRVEHFETVRRRKDGSFIDISLTISPIRNAQGMIVGASKIARDITERRRTQAEQELLMGEMRHRVKNLFALATAIVSISGRSTTTHEDLLATIQARLSSLARAHQLTMADWKGEIDDIQAISLHTLFGTILEPYGARERITISGSDPSVTGKAMTHIALLLHELATNAAKYGSLSVASGYLDVNLLDKADRIELIWRETGGPEPSTSETSGFGSRLETALAGALGATIERDWRPTGLVVSISIPRAAFSG
ncbi:PAS domain S-box protein [Rhizobium sp. AG207R]|nr:PAS domain S-box protein [Rhizobium sp. AG207R]TWB11976.1 PAS domain S-box-containing protein [Rhizobium sp. ERR1071]